MNNNNIQINVTKTQLPPIEDYERYLTKIWKSGQLTNQGPLLKEFEQKTKGYLDVEYFHFVANGTLALQIALRAFGITEGEVITTPFSYVATTSSILWQGCKPVFVDIEPDTLCIDANKIEQAITKNTKAIMAVHVFGNPCDVETLETIAKKHNLKVIYDGAHAFGVKHKNKSLLSYGDISTCSFHSTKPFHTIEGGCVVVKDKEINDKLDLIKRFGHNQDNHYLLGINAKASEFQAAMGLCNLKCIKDIISDRRNLTEVYNKLLNDKFMRPKLRKNTEYNYAYYPIILDSEKELLKKVEILNQENIFPRRYFYPSLNTLKYLEDKQSCPISEDIANRILCLPLYLGMGKESIKRISEILND